MGVGRGSGIFEVEGLLDVFDTGGDLFRLSDADGERAGAAGGAEAEGLVGALHHIGEDRGGHQSLSLDVLEAEVGTFVKETGDCIAEIGVLKPAVEGALGDAGVGGGLGYGGGHSDDGKGGLLASGQAKKADFDVIFCHYLPFLTGERGGERFEVDAIGGTVGGGMGLAGLLVSGGHGTSRGLSGLVDFALCGAVLTNGTI